MRFGSIFALSNSTSGTSSPRSMPRAAKSSSMTNIGILCFLMRSMTSLSMRGAWVCFHTPMLSPGCALTRDRVIQAERDGITRRYLRYLPASGAAGPSIAVSDDDGLAFRTYNRRLVTQVSDEPRLAPRAWRDIVRRCFDDGPRLTGRRAHQD